MITAALALVSLIPDLQYPCIVAYGEDIYPGVSRAHALALFGPEKEIFRLDDGERRTWKLKDGTRIHMVFDSYGSCTFVSMKASTQPKSDPKPTSYLALDEKTKIVPGVTTMEQAKRMYEFGDYLGFEVNQYEQNQTATFSFGVGPEGTWPAQINVTWPVSENDVKQEDVEKMAITSFGFGDGR